MSTITKALLSTAILCLALSLGAQIPNWLWAVRAGGVNEDLTSSIATDSQGNHYVTGRFTGTAYFGSFMITSSGYADIFAAKLDTSGNFLWAVHAGGSSYDEGFGIAVDSEGNSYLTGSFQESATFGSIQLTSSGFSDIFVAKLDPVGNFLWAVSAGGTDSDRGRSIAVDSVGNAVITGHLYSEFATFGSYEITGAGYGDIYVAKLDPAGNWLWAVSAGGTEADEGLGIALDSAGNSYLTGLFSFSAIFGSHTLISSGFSETFAAKLDPAGNFMWAVNTITESNLVTVHGIAVDGSGNVLLTGAYNGTASFGPFTITSVNGYPDIFAAKLDTAGNWLWAVSAGGAGEDYGWSIATDNAGNSYLTGNIWSETTAFGTYQLINSTGMDMFIAKLDPSGNWILVSSTSGYPVSTDISLDGNGNICLTGYFGTYACFGSQSFTSSGGTDIFVAELAFGTPVDEDLAPDAANVSNLYDAFPNPFHMGETTRIKTHIAQRETGILTLFNLRGQSVARHTLSPGYHQVSLDSRDLPSGVYLYQLRTRTCSEIKKLVLLK
ncbi:MAG TPA: SBBP repeat-containing protein [Candidatus Cloacimonadota bacterium]|nr:SBBP repeat-containing protein [Candidatus Cloacimonadota bacterium]